MNSRSFRMARGSFSRCCRVVLCALLTALVIMPAAAVSQAWMDTPEVRKKTENALQGFAEAMASSWPPCQHEAYDAIEDFLEQTPFVFGVAIAYKPLAAGGPGPQRRALHVCRKHEHIKHVTFPQSCDYTALSWYSEPVKQHRAVWSEPYFDNEGAGKNVYMVTYTVPVYKKGSPGTLLGVVTSDLLVPHPKK